MQIKATSSRSVWILAVMAMLTAAPAFAQSTCDPSSAPSKPSVVQSRRIEIKETRNHQIEGVVRGHTLRTDLPKERGGDDTAANPAETFAFALGACVINTGRYIATQEKLALKRISVTLEGSVDMSKILGLETTERAGYKGFTIEVKLEGSLSASEKTKLLEQIRNRCPVCDNVANATPFTLKLKD